MKRILAPLAALALIGVSLFGASGAAAAGDVSSTTKSVATAASVKPVLWEGAYELNPKFPQSLAASFDATTAPTLQVFKDWVKANGKCHTTYQGDLYADDDVTAALIAKGVLNGGDESWPHGEYKDSYSIVITTANCGPETVVVPELEVLPPTCDVDGSLPWTSNPAAQNPNGYEFPGKGYRVYLDKAYTGPGTYVATIQKVGPGFDPAFPNGTKVTGPTSQTLVVLAKTGEQSTDSEAGCYVPIKPEPTSGEDKVVNVNCANGEHKSTVTPWTQDWVLDGKTYVLGEKVYGTAVDTTRPATAAELNEEGCDLPETPGPLVERDVWVDDKYECGDTTVLQSRVVTTTTFIVNPETREVEVATTGTHYETRERDLTEAEIDALDCPVTVTQENPPIEGSLAMTGSNPWAGLWLAFSAAVLGILALSYLMIKERIAARRQTVTPEV